MGLLLLLPPAAAVIFTIYYVITQIRLAERAKSFGCKPAPMFLPWDIFGIQNLRMELQAMTTNRLSSSFVERKRAMSAKVGRDCKTFRIKYPPGETWFYTFDPRNLQAVLATQFHDFQQPAGRVGALEPLLGLGIVRLTSSSIHKANVNSFQRTELSGSILEPF